MEMVQLNSESMFSANKSSLLFAQNAGSDDPKVQLQAVQTARYVYHKEKD